jgi:hypothetical protein
MHDNISSKDLNEAKERIDLFLNGSATNRETSRPQVVRSPDQSLRESTAKAKQILGVVPSPKVQKMLGVDVDGNSKGHPETAQEKQAKKTLTARIKTFVPTGIARK